MGKDQTILDSEFSNFKRTRRRKLLPWWMKIFIWIFLVMGVFAGLGFITGLLGASFKISLYGLSTNDPLSIIGLSLIAVFLLKGMAAFGLWAEKDWAINVALADGIAGILVCCFRMFVYPYITDKPDFTFTFELIVLVPYLIKLMIMKREWELTGSTPDSQHL